MAKALNFNKIKKTYMFLTLADDKHTTLMIGTPNKALSDDLMTLNKAMAELSKEETEDVEESEFILNELYEVCTKILNRNKNGITISKKQVEELLDYEDIIIFFKNYVDYVNSITNSKN